MRTAIEMTTATGLTTAIETQTNGIDITTAPVEPTDEALIAKAKGFNKSIERHLRQGIEAFWKLGETLAALYKRRHLQADGRWASVLKQVGISTTTDNHARRFYAGCDFADLRLYKNKTEALRRLRILATPEGVKKDPADKATKPTAPTTTNEPNGNAEDAGNGRKDAAPTKENGNIIQEPQAEAGVNYARQTGDVQNLLTISRIATILEALATKGLAPTADDLAHLDRIATAVARMKEVALVAAA